MIKDYKVGSSVGQVAISSVGQVATGGSYLTGGRMGKGLES